MVFLLFSRLYAHYKLIGIFDKEETVITFKKEINGDTFYEEESNEINNNEESYIYIGEHGPELYLVTFNEDKANEYKEKYNALKIRKILINKLFDFNLIIDYVETCNKFRLKPQTFISEEG